MKTSTPCETNSEPSEASELSAPSPHSVLSVAERGIDEFLKGIVDGIQCWERAGKLLVELHQQDPAIFKKIIIREPSLTSEMLWSFHRIGLGKLYPRVLLLRKCPAESELLSADYETQKLLCHEPIKVVISLKRDGTPIIEKRWVQEIGKETTNIVFDHGRIRDTESQLSILKAKTPAPTRTYSPAPVRDASTPKFNSINFTKKVVTLACYRVTWTKGEPILAKQPGPVPISATSVLLLEDDDEILGGFVEFRKWGA